MKWRPDPRLVAACLVAAALVGSSTRSGQATPSAPPPRTEVLAPGATLRYRRIYEGCGRVEVGSGPLPPGLVGMDREQVRRAFADARILHFDRRLVELAEIQPGCAPGSAITAILRDGVVVAYYGTPGHLGRVLRVTRIRAERLVPQDRDRLGAGVVVHGLGALDRLLEGLAE